MGRFLIFLLEKVAETSCSSIYALKYIVAIRKLIDTLHHTYSPTSRHVLMTVNFDIEYR